MVYKLYDKNAPMVYTSGINVGSQAVTVQYNGDVYAPNLNKIPFVTTDVFNSDDWHLVRSLTVDDLEPIQARIERIKTIYDFKTPTNTMQDACVLASKYVGNIDFCNELITLNEPLVFVRGCNPKNLNLRAGSNLNNQNYTLSMGTPFPTQMVSSYGIQVVMVRVCSL